MPDLHETINNFLEGSIASIGRTPVIESKSITENGTYTAPSGVDGFNPVVVNVPSQEPNIQPKSIFENGTYNVPSGVDGFNPVVVDVPMKEEITLNVTTNGTYTPSEGRVYNNVIVNVPSQEPNIQPKSIFENGTYNVPSGVDGFNPVVVDVPSKEEITLYANQNGTYTPDENKVYNNVVVNVPLPQNAYLLKSVANLPQAIASFNDGEEMVMPSLKVAIEPQQEGSGDPSPTNIRPISGWNKCNVTVADDIENSTISNVYTIDLDGTRYGGTLDVVSGVLTVDEVNVFFKDLTFTRQARASSVGGYYFRAEIEDNAISDIDTIQLYSHGVSNNPYNSKENCARAFESSPYLFVGFSDDMNITTLADFNTWVSNNQNASICYKIKTPIEIQLTPTAVKSLRGVNNVWADTGDIKDAEYFSKEE